MEAVNYAWCTLVMKGDGYVPGALVFARSVKTVGSKYPVWCMVTPDVSQEARATLLSVFDRVVRVEYIRHPCIPMHSRKQQTMYSSWINESFTKWNVLDPKTFPLSKVMFVDADIIFTENIDTLFELEPPALTYSYPWSEPYREGGIVNKYGVLKHGDVVPNATIKASLDSRQPTFVGLGSMVLLRPSTSLYESLLTILRERKVYGHRLCISGFDEQLISELIVRNGLTASNIHQRYNWMAGKDNWLLNGDKPKTLHYFNDKPWNLSRDAWPDLVHWWKLADDISTKEPASARWFRKR